MTADMERARRATWTADDGAAHPPLPLPPSSRFWPLSELGWRPALAAFALLIGDWLTMLACLTGVWLVRAELLPLLAPDLPLPPAFDDAFSGAYWLVPWTLAFAQARFYTRRMRFRDEMRQAFYASTVAACLVLALAFASRSAESLSRLTVAGLWLSAPLAVPLARYHGKQLLAALGLWRKRVLVIGDGALAATVCNRIQSTPDLGYVTAGVVVDDAHAASRTLSRVPVFGPFTALPELIERLRVQDVVVALPDGSRERVASVIAACEGRVQSIRLVPDFVGVALVGVEAEDLHGVLLLRMRWNLAKPWNLLIKQTFDLLVAAITGVLLAPLWLGAALAIRLDSPGPVLFVQERLGRGGRPFRCIKFRTMYVDGAERLDAHLAVDPGERRDWERYAKLRRHDPRVTRVGRVLRRLSLDELPQLLNVLRREMSVIGPRPYLPSEVERMGQAAETVLKALPGMSGLWQVSGRSDLPFEERLRIEEYYVRNWSLGLDAVLLVKTIGAVLRGSGAY